MSSETVAHQEADRTITHLRDAPEGCPYCAPSPERRDDGLQRFADDTPDEPFDTADILDRQAAPERRGEQEVRGRIENVLREGFGWDGGALWADDLADVAHEVAAAVLPLLTAERERARVQAFRDAAELAETYDTGAQAAAALNVMADIATRPPAALSATDKGPTCEAHGCDQPRVADSPAPGTTTTASPTRSCPQPT